MIGVIVITHGKFGQEMVETACAMLGEQEKLHFFSISPKDGLEKLRRTYSEFVKKWNCPEGVLIFTDMPGGTACNSLLPLFKEPSCEIVGGVNLYMLITALNFRQVLPLKDLTEKVLKEGRENIVSVKEVLGRKCR
jgi:PTS system mannose-specific IIA component